MQAPELSSAAHTAKKLFLCAFQLDLTVLYISSEECRLLTQMARSLQCMATGLLTVCASATSQVCAHAGCQLWEG
jgi:hypothetical protein